MKDQPKKTKYLKQFKMPINTKKNYIPLYFSITQGFMGLQALENGRITSRQLESLRKVLVRKLQKQGKIWFMVFPQHAVSAKAGEVRMGRGKGKVKHWVARILRGQVLIELGGVSAEKAFEAFSFGRKKLPIQTKILGPIV